jgi:hypothetical protein
MERRILDFGVNTGFEEAAERWSLHYPTPISANLVRCVVDRVGHRSEAAQSELTLQQASRPTPEEPPKSLVVAGDGSMLNTREEGWKEAKVAVVAEGEDFLDVKKRRQVSKARYVAVLGGQDEFRKSLNAALEAERADEVMKIVWLGDGAPENWTMASEICPLRHPGARPDACRTERNGLRQSAARRTRPVPISLGRTYSSTPRRLLAGCRDSRVDAMPAAHRERGRSRSTRPTPRLLPPE